MSSSSSSHSEHQRKRVKSKSAARSSSSSSHGQQQQQRNSHHSATTSRNSSNHDRSVSFVQGQQSNSRKSSSSSRNSHRSSTSSTSHAMSTLNNLKSSSNARRLTSSSRHKKRKSSHSIMATNMIHVDDHREKKRRKMEMDQDMQRLLEGESPLVTPTSAVSHHERQTQQLQEALNNQQNDRAAAGEDGIELVSAETGMRPPRTTTTTTTSSATQFKYIQNTAEATKEQTYKVLMSAIQGGHKNRITTKNVWSQHFNIRSLRNDGDDVDFAMVGHALNTAATIFTNQVDDTYMEAFKLLKNLSHNELKKVDEKTDEQVREHKRKQKQTLVQKPSTLDQRRFDRTYIAVRYHHGIPNFEVSRSDCILSRILDMDKRGNILLDRQNFYPFIGGGSTTAVNASQVLNVSNNNTTAHHNSDELQMEEYVPTAGTQSATQGCDMPPNWEQRGGVGIDLDMPTLGTSDLPRAEQDVAHQLGDDNAEFPIDHVPAPTSPNLDNYSDDEMDEAPTFEGHEFEAPAPEPIPGPRALRDSDDEDNEPAEAENTRERDAFGYFKQVSYAPLTSLHTSRKTTTTTTSGRRGRPRKEDKFLSFEEYTKEFDPEKEKIDICNDSGTLKLKGTLEKKKKINKLNIITLDFDFARDLLTPFNFRHPLDQPIPEAGAGNTTRQSTGGGTTLADANDADNHAAAGDFNANNDMELPFVSMPDFPMDDDQGAANEEEENQHQEETRTLNRPDQIENLGLKYARRRKRVDVAGVKSVMQEEIESGRQRSFSTLIERAREETGGGSDVSVGMSFICLLHLTNQHSYVLKQDEPFGDVKVSLENEEETEAQDSDDDDLMDE